MDFFDSPFGICAGIALVFAILLGSFTVAEHLDNTKVLAAIEKGVDPLAAYCAIKAASNNQQCIIRATKVVETH